jgi:cellulose synthase/poly-beta-1,6-N-acetylglucosamine synthase-like glycosyltransferase
MTLPLTIIFWVAVAWIVYVMVGYPLLMALVAWLRPRPLKRRAGYTPRVCLVMAAYNEEKVIERRLRNYQELDYPRELLSFRIGSDASTDATDSIIERFAAADRSIILSRFNRCGKTQIVYELADGVEDEVIVFTDADILMEPDAVRKIVDCMSDPEVGGVIPRMVYHDPSANAGNSGQKKYLELEDWVRRVESLVRTTVGPRGECFAVRRGSYAHMPDYKLSDDLNLVITIPQRGLRVWFEPGFVIHEMEKRSLTSEYRRRLRMGQQAAVTYLAYENTRYPWRSLVGFQIWSHKLMRNLAAIPLALAALTALALAPGSPFFAAIAAGVGLWGLVMLAGYLSDRLSLDIRVLHYPLYFTSMLASLTIGTMRAVFSGGLEMWTSQRLE